MFSNTLTSGNLQPNENLKEKQDIVYLASRISSKDLQKNQNTKNKSYTSMNSHMIGIKIVKPENGIYIFDNKVLPFIKPIIIGSITIKCEVFSTTNQSTKVEILIDNELKKTIYNEPYEWIWNETAFFSHSIKVIAITEPYETNFAQINVSYFNIAI